MSLRGRIAGLHQKRGYNDLTLSKWSARRFVLASRDRRMLTLGCLALRERNYILQFDPDR